MKKQDEVTFFGYNVVCLIDVLGQNQKLARWATLPHDGHITSEFIQALKQTAGTVLGFRGGFIGFFNQLDQCTMPGVLAALPADKQALYARFKGHRVKIERLSDTFVFSCLISNTHGDASVVPLYRLLLACCMAMMWSLAVRTPVRGSITVGAGAELEDGGFYGPALAEAHRLETEVAGYPRVVVSPAVLEFLFERQAYSTDPGLAKIMQRLAETCRTFICQDTDGYWIVDFLGKGMHELLSPETRLAGCVKAAYDFVCSELARFRSSGDAKLAPRYGQLQQYMESRLPVWGVQS